MIRAVARGYLTAKKCWSAAIASFVRGQDAELPTLADEVAVAALVSELKYTGDGPFGLLDFTQDPRHLYWHILKARQDGPSHRWPMIDCDDFAELAVALFGRMRGWRATRLVLVDPLLSKSHVVCWWESPAGVTGTVDTNGLNTWAGYDDMLARFSTAYEAAYVLTSGDV